jgi:hypothetical protein
VSHACKTSGDKRPNELINAPVAVADCLVGKKGWDLEADNIVKARKL